MDVEAVAQAIAQMLERPKSSWASAFDPLRESLSWSQVVEPLRRYCLHAEYAPDRQIRKLVTPTLVKRGKLARVIEIWRTEGSRELLHRIRQKFRRGLAR